MATKPTILIYADHLLAPSMNFVRAQAESLRDFLPVYVGSRGLKKGSLALSSDRSVMINRGSKSVFGKLKEAPFKVFSYAPFFFDRVTRFLALLIHAPFGPAALIVSPLANRLGIASVGHAYD